MEITAGIISVITLVVFMIMAKNIYRIRLQLENQSLIGHGASTCKKCNKEVASEMSVCPYCGAYTKYENEQYEQMKIDADKK